MATTLIIPGLKSSGPSHWQSWLEDITPGSVRVIQRDWNDAHLPDWSARVRREIARTPGQIFLVAHSFGVLAAVQAGADYASRIAGALLVAPADPEIFRVSEFLPQQPLGFPAAVVASTNDPWIRLEQAAAWADRWGAELVNLGAAGHINSESGFGPWPEGLALLERLRRASEFRKAQENRSRLALNRRRHAFGSKPGWRPLAIARDLTRAAALLEQAGWHVRPPADAAVGAERPRQFSRTAALTLPVR